jgi:hypothetical protein
MALSSTLCMNVESVQPVGTRGSVRGTAVREYFAKYFTSPQGQFPGSTVKCNNVSCQHGYFFRENKLFHKIHSLMSLKLSLRFLVKV